MIRWLALGYEPIIGSLRNPSIISWRLSFVGYAILKISWRSNNQHCSQSSEHRSIIETYFGGPSPIQLSFCFQMIQGKNVPIESARETQLGE